MRHRRHRSNVRRPRERSVPAVAARPPRRSPVPAHAAWRGFGTIAPVGGQAWRQSGAGAAGRAVGRTGRLRREGRGGPAELVAAAGVAGPAQVVRVAVPPGRRRPDLESGRGGRDTDREATRTVRDCLERSVSSRGSRMCVGSGLRREGERTELVLRVGRLVVLVAHLIHTDPTPDVPLLPHDPVHIHLGLPVPVLHVRHRRRFDADDPHAAEEDGAAERDQSALERFQGVELAVVDQAGEDRGRVVEAEGGRADEGRADEAQCAVQVGQLGAGGPGRGQDLLGYWQHPLTHLSELADEQHDQEGPGLEVTKLSNCPRLATPCRDSPNSTQVHLIIPVDQRLNDQVHAGLGEEEAQAAERTRSRAVSDREPESSPVRGLEDLCNRRRLRWQTLCGGGSCSGRGCGGGCGQFERARPDGVDALREPGGRLAVLGVLLHVVRRQQRRPFRCSRLCPAVAEGRSRRGREWRSGGRGRGAPAARPPAAGRSSPRELGCSGRQIGEGAGEAPFDEVGGGDDGGKGCGEEREPGEEGRAAVQGDEFRESVSLFGDGAKDADEDGSGGDEGGPDCELDGEGVAEEEAGKEGVADEADGAEGTEDDEGQGSDLEEGACDVGDEKDGEADEPEGPLPVACALVGSDLFVCEVAQAL